jgi:lysophospholipase L1-like esterase
MRQIHANFTGRPGTVARFGDSITITSAFFSPLRGPHQNPPPEAAEALSWIQGYVPADAWNWAGDNFGSAGVKTAGWALQVDQDPNLRNIDLWLSKLNPEMAVIMWGTVDVYMSTPLETYVQNMREIIETVKSNGTIPILTTIPPYHDRVAESEQIAQAIRDLALEQQVPLIDYHDEIRVRNPGDTWDGALAQDPLVNQDLVHGLMSDDGLHPSNPRPFRGSFSDEALYKSGYVLRNYLTLLTLFDVYNQVLDIDPTIVGDANHDGRFDSTDLIVVFQAGEYEDGIPGNSTFEEGDWNGDGDFDSSDIILAFEAGTYVAEATLHATNLAAAVLFDVHAASNSFLDDCGERSSGTYSGSFPPCRQCTLW